MSDSGAAETNSNLARNILQGIGNVLQVAQGAAQLAPVPYISQAVGLLVKIVEIVKAIQDNKDEFQGLAEDATHLLTILCHCRASSNVSQWPPPSLESSIKDLIEALEQTVKFAQKQLHRRLFPRLISSGSDPGAIQGYRQKIQTASSNLQMLSQLTVNVQLAEMISAQINAEAEPKREAAAARHSQVLKTLWVNSSQGATYDSAARKSQDITTCARETREAVINAILKWIEDPDNLPTFFWMYGPAGCGKTTISQTIAEKLKESGLLAASFFWSRSALNRPTTHTNFVATIAYQLCTSIPGFNEVVAAAVDRDPGLFTRNMIKQMEVLIIDPLKQLRTPEVDNDLGRQLRWLLLMDGLDECEGAESQKEVLRLLATAIQQLSLPLRIFVASRDEYAIRSIVTSNPLQQRVEPLALDQDQKPDEDIRAFVKSKFDEIKQNSLFKDSDLADDWPSSDDVDAVVKRSAGLFIYASIVMKYVGSEDHHPADRLSEITSSMSSLGPTPQYIPFPQLDEMYIYVLSTIVPENRQKVRDILSWLILDATKDKTLALCDSLLGFRSGQTRILLKGLASVIDIPPTSTAAGSHLRLFHSSLGEFLQDNRRLGGDLEAFLVDEHVAHSNLAKCWINYYQKKIVNIVSETNYNAILSDALSAISEHCDKPNELGSDIVNGIRDLDLKSSFCSIVPGHELWWDRTFIIVEFLVWLQGHKSNGVTALYKGHYDTVMKEIQTYWANVEQEIKDYIPLLLEFSRPQLQDPAKQASWKPLLSPSNYDCGHSPLQIKNKASRKVLYHMLRDGKAAPQRQEYAQLALRLVDILVADPQAKDYDSYFFYFDRSHIPDFLLAAIPHAALQEDLGEVLKARILSVKDTPLKAVISSKLLKISSKYINKYNQSLTVKPCLHGLDLAEPNSEKSTTPAVMIPLVEEANDDEPMQGPEDETNAAPQSPGSPIDEFESDKEGLDLFSSTEVAQVVQNRLELVEAGSISKLFASFQSHPYRGLFTTWIPVILITILVLFRALSSYIQ